MVLRFKSQERKQKRFYKWLKSTLGLKFVIYISAVATFWLVTSKVIIAYL